MSEEPVTIFNWIRFWGPSGIPPRLDDQGFLPDPMTLLGLAENPELRPLDTFLRVPCLVLLGESGSGKSTELARASRVEREQFATPSDRVAVVALGERDPQLPLERAIFLDGAARASGDGRLFLWLDSLDEGREVARNIAVTLGSVLRQVPAARIRLRLTCRADQWPVRLESVLREHWGQDSVKVINLAPLCTADVDQAADELGLDAVTFREAIARQRLGPLAALPLTLGFLLRLYEPGRGFPESRASIFEEACRALASDEHNELRREAGWTGPLDPGRRVTIASRLAALSLLGDRPLLGRVVPAPREIGILTPRDASDRSDRPVTVGQAPQVTEGEVSEVIGTALFLARGRWRGWLHRAIAEYLAARWLAASGCSPTQLSDLLVYSDGHIFPQVSSVAAWLGTLAPGFAEARLATDPDVLLQGDVASWPAERRAALAAAILAGFASGMLADRQYSLRHAYASLAHLGLGGQLRPTLMDRSVGHEVRLAALAIAGACGGAGVETEAAQIALDPEESAQVRIDAALTVASGRDDRARVALLPLALARPADDEGERLQGAALWAAWPVVSDASELFAALHDPLSAGFGLYRHVVEAVILPHLPATWLPVALSWLAERFTSSGLWTRRPLFSDAIDVILLRSWEQLDDERVLKGMASVLATRGRRRAPLTTGGGSLRRARNAPSLRQQIRSSPARRQLLLSATLAALSDDDEARAWVDTPEFGLGDPDAQLEEPDDHVEAPARTEAISESNPHLRLGQAEEVDSNALVDRLVVELTPGPVPDRWDVPSWADVLAALRPVGFDAVPPQSWPGWDSATEPQRELILASALSWLKAGKHLDPMLGVGVAALRLLGAARPAALDTLIPEAWADQLPELLLVPSSDYDAVYPNRPAVPSLVRLPVLIARAVAAAPAQARKQVCERIVGWNASNGTLPDLDRLAECDPQLLAPDILGLLDDPTLTPRSIRTLFDLLLRWPYPPARQCAAELIAAGAFTRAGHPRQKGVQAILDRAIAVAVAWLGTIGAGDWPTVRKALLSSRRFGRALVTQLAMDSGRAWLPHIPPLPADMAELWRWLDAEFGQEIAKYRLADDAINASWPFDDDEVRAAARRQAGMRAMLEAFQAQLVERLVNHGSTEAVRALRGLSDVYPAADWLQRAIVRGERVARERAWLPVEPSVLLNLATDRLARHIRDGDAFLTLVEVALRGLEVELHGTTPQRQFLWDRWQQGGEQFARPKEEDALSDWIATSLRRALAHTGAIVNREVELSRKLGGSEEGDIPDLLVQLPLQGGSGEVLDQEALTVVIEVKGDWHRKVRTAMGSQLVERYMRGRHCHYGIYVVGRFHCAVWSDEPRKRQSADLDSDLDAVRDFFAGQAHDLSDVGVTVRAVVLDCALR